MEKIEKSLKKLEIINQWISNCDTKSSFIMTFLGVIITLILTSEVGAEMMKTLTFHFTCNIDWITIKNFLSFNLTLFFFVSISFTFYNIYKTLIGRIDSKVYAEQNLNTDSNLFFGNIASKKFTDFENETNTESDAEYLNDINSQIFINSNIVTEKFKYYNKSLIWSFITLCIFLTYIFTK